MLCSTSGLLSEDGRCLKTCSSLLEQGIEEGAYLTAVARVPHVCCTKKAFALWFEQGEVVAWGDARHGGHLPRPLQVELLGATDYAFAAVQQGRLAAWGHPAWGGTAPELPVEAKQLLGNSMAFCLLQASGELLCWGRTKAGGRGRPLQGVKVLGATSYAFAAATERHVHTWGMREYGGGEMLEIEGVYEPLL